MAVRFLSSETVNGNFIINGAGVSTDFQLRRSVNAAALLTINAPGGSPNGSVFSINGNSVMTLDENQNATFAGDVTVTGGDLTLGTDSIASNINAVGDVLAINVDSNTGGGAGANIQLKTAGTSQLTINSSSATFAGQVHIDSKPNSGLAYNVLIDVGSSGDGTIGYQTVDQLAANIGASTSSNWVKTGNDIYNSNSGNVGIGTITPAQKLEIAGGYLKFSGGDYGIQGSASLTYNPVSDHYFQASGSTKVTIKASGNVGIGTSSPSAPLDVQGTGALFMTRTSGGLATYIENDGGYPFLAMYQIGAGARVLINTNGNSYFNGGNVGIGTTSPGAKLDVKSGVQSDTVSIANAAAYLNGLDVGIIVGQSASGPYGTWIQSIRRSDGASFPISLNPSGSGVGIGTTSPDRTLDVEGTGMAIFGTGDYTELMLRGQVEGTGTVRNVGSFHWSIRGDVGGDNDDLKLLRFVTGTYSGIAMQIQNSTGNVGIGTTSPAEKLEVSGSVKIGNLKIQNADSGRIGFNRNTATGAIYNSNSSAIQINGPSSSLNYLSIEAYNSSGNFTSQMVYTGSGNLGIGTTSPQRKLTVVGSSDTAGDNSGILQVSSGTGANTDSKILFGVNGNAYVYIQGVKPGTDHMDIILNPNGNKKVGIGTTSPTAKLEITTAVGTDAIRANFGQSADIFIGFNSTNPRILLQDNSNIVTHDFSSNANNYIVGSNLGIGTTDPEDKLEVASGSLKIKTSANHVEETYIKFGRTDQANGNFENHIKSMTGSGASQNKMTFSLCDTSATGKVDLLTLDGGNNRSYFGSGNVGIGTTTPPDKLYVDAGTASMYTGHFVYGGTDGAKGCLKLRTVASTGPSFIDFFYDGFSTNPLSPVGAIVTTGSATLYSSYSDYRLKENVADLTGALDRVNNLQPKTFNYINVPEITNEGFLAHELQEIVPQAVSGTKDGVDEDGNPKYQGVDNAHIVPLLVGAIKELKAEIENLKSQIQ